ncbi:MAG: nucleotide exchange factor GrpE [bacterium]|nr:nucleotide exchange factor GrpE [bacterium]
MTKKDDAKIKIEELEKQKAETTEKYLRCLADYQNLEKRTRTEREDFVRFANKELILKLLDVLDTFEKLEAHLKDEGLDLAVKQFQDVLRAEGLEKIVLGEEFNPEEAECVETVKGKTGEIIEEIRAGYKLKGRIIRTARVKVGKS